jgi:hypothetical protein
MNHPIKHKTRFLDINLMTPILLITIFSGLTASISKKLNKLQEAVRECRHTQSSLLGIVDDGNQATAFLLKTMYEEFSDENENPTLMKNMIEP